MPTICKKCGLLFDGFSGNMVILKNQLWAKISEDNIRLVLCDKCIEDILGRSLGVRDFQPGILTNLNYNLSVSGSRKCEDCGKGVRYRLYLKMGIWEREIGNLRLFLCPECIEKRLGRKITKDDLIPKVYENRMYLRYRSNYGK